MNTQTAQTSRQKFDLSTYQAALAYYGLPSDYGRVFTQSDSINPNTGTPSLIPCNAEQACQSGKPVWVQVNTSNPDAALDRLGRYKKPANKDIAVVKNITIDVEYSPDPLRLRRLVIELVSTLVDQGLLETRIPIEDSGAGNHLVIPIAPIDVADWGGHDVVNAAIDSLVRTHIDPFFDELLKKYKLDGLRPELAGDNGKPKPIKLECFDIGRILSAPGTFRPGNTKPNETASIIQGHLRGWVYPYDQEPPKRVESQIMTDLVKAFCNTIQAEKTETEAATKKKVAVTTGSSFTVSANGNGGTHKLSSVAEWLNNWVSKHLGTGKKKINKCVG